MAGEKHSCLDFDLALVARAVLSCHSCLLLAAWYDRKPAFTAYPDDFSLRVDGKETVKGGNFEPQ
jgi:hypothetical protein